MYTIYCATNVWPVAYSERAAPNVSKVKFGDDVPVRSPEAASSLDAPPQAGAGGGSAAHIIMEVSVRSDFVDVLHVLKRAELVEDVGAEVVDEGFIIIGAVQGHPIITGEAIGH